MTDMDDYSDIIDLPHHVSARHLPMPMEARAAQFAPFSALTGFEDSIDETARQKAAAQGAMDEWEAEFYARVEALRSSKENAPR